MLHTEIQNKLPGLALLFKKHKIKNAFAFGSAVTSHFRKDSDIDILVNIDDQIDPSEAGGHLWDLQEELEKLFQREIDLITERSLRNPYFISEINDTKIRIYG